MHRWRLAAWLDSYRAGLKHALTRVVEDGYQAFQADGSKPEWNPREFTRSARRHLAHHLRGLGLTLDALVLNWPGPGLADPAHVEARLAHLTGVAELCADVRAPRVGLTLSGFAGETASGLAAELLPVLVGLADRYALEVVLCPPAGEVPAALAALRRIDCPLLGLGVDSARFSPGEAYALLDPPGLRVLFLRDVRREGERIEEVAFGRGEVDFVAWLGTLAAADFTGAVVIRREVPPGEVDALRRGREYILSLFGRLGPA